MTYYDLWHLSNVIVVISAGSTKKVKEAHPSGVRPGWALSSEITSKSTTPTSLPPPASFSTIPESAPVPVAINFGGYVDSESENESSKGIDLDGSDVEMDAGESVTVRGHITSKVR